MLMVIFFFLNNYYGGWDGKGDQPSWVCFVSAFCYYTYHVRLTDLIELFR
jgi:hypothetical protein